MAWRDTLLPSSLEGVVFSFRTVTTTVGRRTIVHEHYGDRPPWVEDIGPATFRITMDAFVVGTDYQLQRDALRDVLNTEGPYEFVHPLWGVFTVRSEGPTELSESIAEGGLVRIGRLSLVEAGDPGPTVFEQSSGKIAELAALAAAALAANTSFSILGAIDSVVNSIKLGLFKATNRIRKMNGKIGAVLGTLDQISSQLDEFDQAIDSLLNTPNALMSSLTGLGLSVMGVLQNFELPVVSVEVDEPEFPLVDLASDSIEQFSGFETVPDTTDWVPPDGPQGVIDEAQHAEVSLQMQGAGVIGGAELAATLPFDSAQQAGAMVEQLTDAFEKVMSAPTLSPDTYEALAALRAATLRNLLDQQAELPQVVRVTPATVLPAVVLAWELFGDAEEAGQLVRRNRVVHPGFVPAEELEVVVSA